MDCFDHFEYKGFVLPYNMSKYVKGGVLVKDCKRLMSYPSSEPCDGESHIECASTEIISVLLLAVALLGVACVVLLRKKRRSNKEVARELAARVEWLELTARKGKAAGPSEGVGDDREEPPGNMNGPRPALYPGLAALCFCLLVLSPEITDACSQVFPLGDKYESCHEGRCKTQWVYSLSVGNGDEICIPTPDGLVKLGTLTAVGRAMPDFDLVTSSWILDVKSRRHCYATKHCELCSDGEVQRTFSGAHYDVGGCFSKCGCVSCGCLSCAPSCLFWTATVKPVGPKQSAQRFSNFNFGVGVKHGDKLTFLEQGRHMQTSLGKIYVDKLAPPPVSPACVLAGKLLDTSDCRPNMRGPFGLTYTEGNLTFDHSRIHCSSHTTEEVSCVVAEDGQSMTSHPFPQVRGNFLLEKQGGDMLAMLRSPLSFSVFLKRDEPLALKFVSSNRSCSIVHSEKLGCFGCEEGFIVLLTMKGHGHCYYENQELLVQNTLIDCSTSVQIRGFTNKRTLPRLHICGEELSITGQLSPPKVQRSDGTWTGRSEESSSWWSPLTSLQTYSVSTVITVGLSLFACLLGLLVIKLARDIFR